MEKIKCPICGKEIDGETYKDCLYCGWGYTGLEDCYERDEKEDFNNMSVNEAKALLHNGKDVYGKLLKK